MDGIQHLEVFIKTSAKKSAVIWDTDLKKYIVHVKSLPIKGKANKEVISILKEFFKADEVILERGANSTTKIFELRGAKEEVYK